MADTQRTSSLIKLLACAVPLVLAAGAWYTYQTGGPAGAQAAALSQSLPSLARRAMSGDASALNALTTQINTLDSMRLAGELPGEAGAWDRLLNDARLVVAAGKERTASAAAAAELTADPDDLIGRTRALLISAGAVNLVGELDQQQSRLATFGSRPGPAASVVAADADSALEWIGNALAALAGEFSAFEIAPLTEAADLERLQSVRDTFADVSAQVAAVMQAATDASAQTSTLRSLDIASGELLPRFAEAGGSLPAWLLPGLFAVTALISLVVAIALWRASRKAGVAAHQAAQNERNQHAILRLLDELGSLADGDLTVEATVTEDITGAIADSINYAIEALRGLVATINDTSIMVDSAAKQTEAGAKSMSQSARLQAHEVKATTDELGAIIAAIEEVSGNAERSSDVARHSVDVAHKGGEAVRRTIDGMNAIRETIQETSKRIKRLGESSQEIGNIVELINDIAEQTNILALNASIQASMAGEAGRGFAVVADEVQRLAERCTNATKQIEVLVRTIQADTNEAVVSMERSTTDVVGGALLAENAGAALDEIEQVSNQIASLVQNISTSAREQNTLAARVDKRTTTLTKISAKTGRETLATAAAISKLSELASQLRGTVAGFQLPDAAGDSGAYVTDDDLADSAPERLTATAANARG
ncbi:MAG: methyl-accepting chemotaxis protein [Pseudomonadota bacterium]